MSDKADYWAEYFSQDKETIEFDQWLEKEIQKNIDDSASFNKETIEFDQWLEKEIQKMLFNTESEDNEHE